MKRWYQAAACVQSDGGWQVTLDGRAIKTAAGKPQIVPNQALALELAAEWSRQPEQIDPATLVWRDLADLALDFIAGDRRAAIAALLRFSETDTLCYRAEADTPLHARQLAQWEPLLAAIEARLSVAFVRIEGIAYQPQPPATLARLESVLAGLDNFALAALTTLASLAASLVIGLAALEPRANAETLWLAANLEEDWQAEQWGIDAEAQALRARRLGLFGAAIAFAAAARN